MTAIAEASNDPVRVAYCLRRIDEASKHLLSIINDILDMSKIEADRFEMKPVRFRLPILIESVENIISVRVEGKNQTLITSIEENMPENFFGDDTRLIQVIINLLSNAVKFTGEGGKIELKVTGKMSDDGQTCLVTVSVRDNGIGISEEQQETLFEAFKQADAGMARKYGGTGLGLALTKRVVEQMGGRVGLSSKLGVGTTFFIEIPLSIAQDEDAQADAGALADETVKDDAPPRFDGAILLIAEDVEINREIVISLLDGTGVTIEEAENGEEAVRMYAANPTRYDLIFMDIQMPEMDGFEATRAIRRMADEDVPEVPIIAMSANAFKEDIEMSLASGMNEHLSKPVDYGKLIATLQKYLK
jgi:CheY-like chemotaxis protein/two-component sensor histidine kinase